MINNLKTLKDIEEETAKKAGLKVEDVLVDGFDVRQEAIKWVKKFFPISKKGYEFTLGDFMEFFNITSEDLKS